MMTFIKKYAESSNKAMTPEGTNLRIPVAGRQKSENAIPEESGRPANGER
jgi:hypothetical protein